MYTMYMHVLQQIPEYSSSQYRRGNFVRDFITPTFIFLTSNRIQA